MTAIDTHDAGQQVRRSHTHSLEPESPTARFRPDIEGLRAFAVLLVFIDHLADWPKGGFIGVDVFFVISGFLITGLLLKESEQHGRISFLRFYERRARRILPAALSVLAAVWIACHLAFKGVRVTDTVTDIWWALGFSANIHFANIGTDYFQATRPPSPVQHFWSLAVEEQFYLVWPLVMAIVLGVLRHRASRRTQESYLLAVVCAGTLASFIWALEQTHTAPAAAYFSTPVRAWELGVGAVAAIAVTRFPSVPRRIGRRRGPLVLVGLICVILSAFRVESSAGFPAPWAAFPVMSTALILFAGAGGPADGWSFALTNSASRYIGRISYSLYLWHWPTIVVVAALLPKKPTLYYVVVIAATFGLSIASYHFIESPCRRLGKSPRRRRTRSAADRSARMRSMGYASTAAFALIAVAVGSYESRPAATNPTKLFAGSGQPSLVTRGTGAAANPSGEATIDPTVAVPSAGLSDAIQKALLATSWPKLSPSLDELGTTSAQKEWSGCRGATAATLAGCTFGDPTAPPSKTAVVIGDSYAMAWMPAIQGVLVPEGWRIYGLELEECPASDVSVNDEETPPKPLPACDVRHAFNVAEAIKLDPGLVILASADNTVLRLASGATGQAAASEYADGLVKTISALQPSSTRRVVTLSAPPQTLSLQSCDTVNAVPADCVGKILTRATQVAAAEKSAAAKTATTFVNTANWFCSPAGYCPSFVGATPVRWDNGHITDAYAKILVPELAPYLVAR